MAAKKYFIGSCINFIVGRGSLVSSGSSATHYKMNDAVKIIGSRKDLQVYKIRKTAKGRDYIIGQKISYIGNDNNIVDTFEAAKKFDSAASALEYANKCCVLLNELENPQIYDTDYNKKCIAINKNVEEETSLPSEEDNLELRIARKKINPSKKAKIYSKYGKLCAICGRPINIDDLSIDHIKPISRGGTNEDDNLQPVHDICNKMKQNMMKDEFIDLANTIVANNFINDFKYDDMITVARAIVRGNILSLGGLF